MFPSTELPLYVHTVYFFWVSFCLIVIILIKFTFWWNLCKIQIVNHIKRFIFLEFWGALRKQITCSKSEENQKESTWLTLKSDWDPQLFHLCYHCAFIDGSKKVWCSLTETIMFWFFKEQILSLFSKQK